MDDVGPAIGAGVFVLLMQMVREPTRQRVNAVLVAGASGVYLSGGFGVWELLYPLIVTPVAVLVPDPVPAPAPNPPPPPAVLPAPPQPDPGCPHYRPESPHRRHRRHHGDGHGLRRLHRGHPAEHRHRR